MYIIDMKDGAVCYTIAVGETPTSMKFSPCNRFIVVTALNGCIYLWKTPGDIYMLINLKLKQQKSLLSTVEKRKANKRGSH